MNADLLCMNCFKLYDGSACPLCGYHEEADAPPHHLRPRTILSGKYLLGRVLGEGGFGITYIGWDLNLQIKVAIKEFYPTGFVTRDTALTMTVTPYIGSQGDFFRKGRERFVQEARALAKFFSLPGIVPVKDYFQENGTAYIVMAYIEGQTIKSYLAQMGGILPSEQVFTMMRPVMTALAEVHKNGLIHRDISPDNIMIGKEGLKLLDFGAAREFEGGKSLSVMLKPGYAPEEQYRTKGVQGPWTDVYALCATIYKCVTGLTPDEALDRIRIDEVKSPSELGVAIDPAREAALMKGMAVLQENRWNSIPELIDALYGQTVCPDPPPVPTVCPVNPPDHSDPPPVKQGKLPLPPWVLTVRTVLGIGSVLSLLLYRFLANTMAYYEGSRAMSLITLPLSFYTSFFSSYSYNFYAERPVTALFFLFAIGGLCGVIYFATHILYLNRQSTVVSKKAYIPHIAALVITIVGMAAMILSMIDWFEVFKYDISVVLLSVPYALHALTFLKSKSKTTQYLAYTTAAAFGFIPFTVFFGA